MAPAKSRTCVHDLLMALSCCALHRDPHPRPYYICNTNQGMLPLRFSQFLCDHFFSDDLILLPVPTFPFLLPLHAGRRRGVMVGGTTGPLKGITHILTLLFCFFLYTLC